MQAFQKQEKQPYIKINTSTWYKDSHSLYDYQSTKVTEQKMEFPITSKWLNIYRKKNNKHSPIPGPDIQIIDAKSKNCQKLQDYQFIAHCQLQNVKGQGLKFTIITPSAYKDKTKENYNQKEKTNSSVDSINQKEEEPYYIVSRSSVSNSNSQAAYPLKPGMTLKLGRIQYFVTEYCDGNKKETKSMPKTRSYFNETVLKCEPLPPPQKKGDKNQCKICLDELDEGQNFLFNPCKCNGSCGTVHYACLAQWIRIKVKKDVIGGTQHYNFSKFQCEVCKAELPGYIQYKSSEGKVYNKELISLDRPKGTYLIFEGACQKEKSIMILRDPPETGIKLGRGHECQIRITDISVSRKHAFVKANNNEFYILDNNSKFGTLVREQNLSFQIKKQYQRKSIQIGRSILQFQIMK